MWLDPTTPALLIRPKVRLSKPPASLTWLSLAQKAVPIAAMVRRQFLHPPKLISLPKELRPPSRARAIQPGPIQGQARLRQQEPIPADLVLMVNPNLEIRTHGLVLQRPMAIPNKGRVAVIQNPILPIRQITQGLNPIQKGHAIPRPELIQLNPSQPIQGQKMRALKLLHLEIAHLTKAIHQAEALLPTKALRQVEALLPAGALRQAGALPPAGAHRQVGALHPAEVLPQVGVQVLPNPDKLLY